MLNWIHFTIKAPVHVLTSIAKPLRENLGDTSVIINREENNLFVETFEVDAVYDQVEKVSKDNPDEEIKVHYCASISGSYHTIDAVCINGNMEITCDERLLVCDA